MTVGKAPDTSATPDMATTGRVVAVDVTRGLAILGMIAVHVLPGFTRSGEPTLATVLAAGKSATAFAFVAGLSLAFLSGATRPVSGQRRRAAMAGIAVRGVLIGLLGFLLAYLEVALVILPAYGLMFLLVLPLLTLPPRHLVAIAAALALLGPVLVVASARAGLPQGDDVSDPTLTTLVHSPGTVLLLLLVTGSYPIVIYLVYMLAGLAVGRQDLRSPRLAWWLFGGGVAMVVLAQAGSAALLYGLGGLRRLGQAVALADHDSSDDDHGGWQHDSDDYSGGESYWSDLLWEPHHEGSWWYLALPSPHAGTTFDIANTLGTAMAVLGVLLLLTRTAAATRLLRPIADVGSMPLTIYSAHLVILWTEVLDRRPHVLFVVIVVAAVAFAVLWRRRFGQGPLERVLAGASRRARDAVSRPRE